MEKKYGKISLDLDELVAQGEMDDKLATRLEGLKLPSLATNYLISVLYIIGALAAAAGVVLLKPEAITGLLIGFVCLVAGQFILWRKIDNLHILALALGIGSAAGFTGWFVLEFGETLPALTVNGFATLVTLIIALLFRSRFLSAIVPIGIGSMIGSGGSYWHAAYGIYVQEAAISIVLFTVLTALFAWLSHGVFNQHRDWNPMSTVAARMSLIVANFGFWVGSLWGDYVGEHLAGFGWRDRGSIPYKEWNAAKTAFRETTLYIQDDIFAVAWVGFAIAMIVIGKKLEQRFIAIAGVVFLAINAFTQYFEYFRDEPWALIFGGIALVAIALGLVRYEVMTRKAAQSPSN